MSDAIVVPDGVDTAGYLLLAAAVSAAQMTGYLLAVSLVLDGTGRGGQFPLFVSTYLWCSLVSTLAGLLATSLVIDAPLNVANIVIILLGIWSLAYSWFSVRASLACPGALAAGLVVLEILTALAADPLPSQLIQAAARG